MSAYGVLTLKRDTSRHFCSSGPEAGAAKAETLPSRVQARTVIALPRPMPRREASKPREANACEFFMGPDTYFYCWERPKFPWPLVELVCASSPPWCIARAEAKARYGSPQIIAIGGWIRQ